MPGFPQFTASPPIPVLQYPADVAQEIRRARRAQVRLGQLYCGQVYRILYEAIDNWIEMGYRLDKVGYGRALFDEILTAPLPERMPGA